MCAKAAKRLKDAAGKDHDGDDPPPPPKADKQTNHTDPDCAMNHFLFTVPSTWDNSLYPLQFKSKTVLWLQAIAISDSEKDFAGKNGANALGEKLESAKADLTDFSRQCVV